jgi:tRNA modification GTPase
MSANHVSVLTPAGSSAIAVLAIRGPNAWESIHRFFQPVGVPLGESAPRSGFRFGRFGRENADEVVVVIRESESFEIHCHGGRRVVESFVEIVKSAGIDEIEWTEFADAAFANRAAAALLPFARTVRTASILLDQAHGAYDRAVAAGESMHNLLRRNARIGRHLVRPWTVAIAGAPNAGKSTLLNALAGFARSIVSPMPGTTRDAVTASLAFDGWPIDLIDIAGLRDSPDAIEREGVERAKNAIAECDLCLWVVDATSPRPKSIHDVAQALGRKADDVLVVFNKCDLIDVPETELPEVVRVSAATGNGLSDLAARMIAVLVPNPPRPGEPVPFTAELCDRWS